MPNDSNKTTPITMEGLTAWLEVYQKRQDSSDKRQEAQAQDISDLTRDVGQLTANVQSLIDNQKGIFHRQNRPLPLGAIIGAFTLLIIMAGLLIAPMQREQGRQHLFDVEVAKNLKQDAFKMGMYENGLGWLAKMEQRIDESVHACHTSNKPN